MANAVPRAVLHFAEDVLGAERGALVDGEAHFEPHMFIGGGGNRRPSPGPTRTPALADALPPDARLVNEADLRLTRLAASEAVLEPATPGVTGRRANTFRVLPLGSRSRKSLKTYGSGNEKERLAGMIPGIVEASYWPHVVPNQRVF